MNAVFWLVDERGIFYCRLSFFFPLSLIERRNPNNSELHVTLWAWRHKLFKEGIFSRAWYLSTSTVVFANTTLYGIPKDKYPSDGEKRKKTKNW